MNWQRTCRMFRNAFRARRERVREEYGPPHSWMQRKVKLEAELRAAGGDVIFEPFAPDHMILLRVRGRLAMIDLKVGEATLFPEPPSIFDSPKLYGFEPRSSLVPSNIDDHKPDVNAALYSYAKWMGVA